MSEIKSAPIDEQMSVYELYPIYNESIKNPNVIIMATSEPGHRFDQRDNPAKHYKPQEADDLEA